MKIKFNILFGLMIITYCVSAQSKVHFHDDNFKKVMNIAKLEGKGVFVDTWASWCIPCKRQDKVFHDPRVIKYLNNNFINLRVNMGKSKLTNEVSKVGKKMNLEYEVVFLPTLLVLNHEGEVKAKTDNFLDADQLLSFLRYSKDKKAQKFESSLNNIPFNRSGPDEVYVTLPNKGINTIENKKDSTKDQEVLTRKGKEIVEEKMILEKEDGQETTLQEEEEEEEELVKGDYLFIEDDNNIEDYPSYFYNQTILSIQNMDNEYKVSYMRYLATQKDWSTEKNMKFIYNYIHTTQSLPFQYMIDNKADFEAIIGAERYEKSIQILIYNRLYKGFPRATFDDAVRLYSYLYSNIESIEYANQYYLQRLLVDKEYQLFVILAKKRLKKTKNTGLMLTLANVYNDHTNQPKKALRLIKKAIKIDSNNHRLHFEKVKIYISLGKDQKAYKSLSRAKTIAGENNLDFPEWESYIHKINNLKTEL